MARTLQKRGTCQRTPTSSTLDDVGLGQSDYKMILDVHPDIYKLDRYLLARAWNDPYRQVILDSLARMGDHAPLVAAH